ncbi:hypothetical protein P8452_47203 [Trifolium repens]|nr:hypothetical protein P8452_47203 [Trifolium repens]
MLLWLWSCDKGLLEILRIISSYPRSHKSSTAAVDSSLIESGLLLGMGMHTFAYFTFFHIFSLLFLSWTKKPSHHFLHCITLTDDEFI